MFAAEWGTSAIELLPVQHQEQRRALHERTLKFVLAVHDQARPARLSTQTSITSTVRRRLPTLAPSTEHATVPSYYLAKPQPRERAWDNQRGKKTLLSLTLVRLYEMT